MQFDYLIVGAGSAGSVLAERLASQSGKTVLIVDKRAHIGGNAYDRYDSSGILIHPYGPHIFHTNSERIFAYLSQFTEWRAYEHRIVEHYSDAARIAYTPAQFVWQCEAALSEDNTEWLASGERYAQQNTWDNIVSAVKERLDAVVARSDSEAR